MQMLLCSKNENEILGDCEFVMGMIYWEEKKTV